jgi:hypothetical protein
MMVDMLRVNTALTDLQLHQDDDRIESWLQCLKRIAKVFAGVKEL